MRMHVFWKEYEGFSNAFITRGEEIKVKFLNIPNWMRNTVKRGFSEKDEILVLFYVEIY